MEKNKRKNGIIIPLNLKEKNERPFFYDETLEDFVDECREEMNIENKININDELIINISHELRTPLNIIYGAAQMIDVSMRDGNGDKVVNYVDFIKNNCFRLTKYINNILDLTKIESGEYKLNLEYVNIVGVIEYVVQSTAQKIKEKGLNIVFDTNVEEKYVMIDTHLFEKSILNIISNAVKFSKPEGNIIVIFTEHKNSIEISVKDNGIGIDKSYLEKVFKRFGQVDKSISRSNEGSGIGLRLAKTIIELHGGKVNVESKLNVGSTFMVNIPLNNKETFYKVRDNDKLINYDTINELVNIEFSDIFNIS